MMKCEDTSYVLSCGKCAANEIAVLNQICKARVIECCFETVHVFMSVQKREHGKSRSTEHKLCPLTRDDKDCEDLI